MQELNYLYAKPIDSAILKQQDEDFVVIEELGYPITGEGEFVIVKIRKQNCNTIFVGEKLAQFAGISAKLMSYAGLKDRHAITEQIFCLHMPGQETPDFSTFQLDGVEIIELTRHNRKIRIGSLAGNQFKILLRNIQSTAELNSKLINIKQNGFPNYFTEQRFGRDNENIKQALRWANGEIKVKDRHKRSFYLSAARSMVFNQLVSARIAQNLASTVLVGDIVQLHGSHSWFIVKPEELVEVQARLASGDVLLTGAMLGEDSLEQGVSSQAELEIMPEYSNLIKLMHAQRVKAARRPMFIKPTDFTWDFKAQDLELNFYLPAGSYATALVREIASVEQGQ